MTPLFLSPAFFDHMQEGWWDVRPAECLHAGRGALRCVALRWSGVGRMAVNLGRCHDRDVGRLHVGCHYTLIRGRCLFGMDEYIEQCCMWGKINDANHHFMGI